MFRRTFYRAAWVSALLLAACQQFSQQQFSQQQGQPEQEPQAGSTEEPGAASEPSNGAALPKNEGNTPDKERTKPTSWQPVSVPSAPFVPKAPGRRVARVDVPGPYVALTFDDGPSPANTPRILDILKRHGAHATFFVAGENAVHNKGILARAASEGHEIGSHTYSHIKLTGSSDAKIESEMSRTSSIIEEATGRKPVLMRPPYGATNKRIVDKMYNDYGMTSVLWDVDTRDWQHPGVDVVVRRAVGNARAGSIILVHDIHASTLAAVEDIVVGLQARGFKLVTVSQLLALGACPAPAEKTPAAVAEPPVAAPSSETAAPALQPAVSVPAPAMPAMPATLAPVPAPKPVGNTPAAPQEYRGEPAPGSASISIEHTPSESNEQ